MSTSDRPAPRRYLQFSLKSLMLLMLLSAAFFAGWSIANRKVRRLEALARQAEEEARVAEMQARYQAEVALAQAALQSQRTILLQSEIEALREPSARTEGEGAESSESPISKAIEAVLRLQADAWNNGDIDAFMEHYWKSPQLTFSSGGQTTRGWEATLARYRKRYPTREKVGRLTFEGLEIFPLGTEAALVLGRWHVARDPEALEGNFSLVLRKVDDRWLIVHDHTSQTPKPSE
jgi:beta-aspartyl-peptidase (threonine type)